MMMMIMIMMMIIIIIIIIIPLTAFTALRETILSFYVDDNLLEVGA